MAKCKKMRLIDYSVDELCEMAGMERTSFIRALEKICDIYSINIRDFKSDKDSTDSTYFFPPDVGQLVVLLVKNLSKHPLHRRNATSSSLSARKFSMYNKCLVKDIDENISDNLKKYLYCCDDHYTAVLVDEWTNLFMDKFIVFVVSFIKTNYGDIGETLKCFARNLSNMDYNLFRTEYIKGMCENANYQALSEQGYSAIYFGSSFQKCHQHLSLEYVIVNFLKDALRAGEDTRQGFFNEYKIDDAEINTEKIEDKRKEFFDNEYPVDGEIKARYEHNKAIIDSERKLRKKWLEPKDRTFFLNYLWRKRKKI